jgi:UDP-glucuronate 4-epimerase
LSTIVVTGSAGFIGSHLVERLLADGHVVHGVDTFDDFYDPRIKRDNLAAALEHDRFTLHEGDIRDEAAMRAVWAHGPFDSLVHLAARAGVRPSLENPRLYYDVNLNGTVNLLEICRENPDTTVVFASSSSVYGNQRKVPFSEDDPVDHPISPYAASKKAGELLCHAYHDLYKTHITCLRFFTVYGPRVRPDLAIGKFTRMIDHGETLPIFGDGTARRDFTYIDDIVAGVVAAIERPKGYAVYNLGESEPVVLSRLIELIADAVGKQAVLEHLPQQPGDVDQTYADITRARAELGYNPKTKIEDGIAKVVAWYRDTLREVRSERD